MKTVVVTGGFDDLRLRQVRFLHEASRLGELHVLMWSDASLRAMTGNDPEFPQEERAYLLRAIRYVSCLTVVSEQRDPDRLPSIPDLKPDVWAVESEADSRRKQAFAQQEGIEYRILSSEDLRCPCIEENNGTRGIGPARAKVVVTGCYDWLHSGHVRFFEEASQFGTLYAIVGNDRNLRLLKGGGHPMFPQEERRYMVQAVRHVHQALITSGSGWVDAEPEIARIKPDKYIVNEDGDRPEKRAFCASHGLRYLVLKRVPRPGLPMRQSRDLRGY